MAHLPGNRRRTKLVTPANSSFSDCVQDNLFIHPIRGALDDFKPVLYLDEHGRKHGRVSDHLLQRQIEQDRANLKKNSTKKVPVSSTLYGIRNPNVVAMVRDVPIEKDENEDNEEEEKAKADEEIKMIEFKKSSKGGTAKGGSRQISSISGKQSVKFETTPSVNMVRLADSHLTELDDIIDDDEGETGTNEDEDELESMKRATDPDSSNPSKMDKTPFTFSETPSSAKDGAGEILTGSSLDYNQRASEDVQVPPSVEDVIEEEKQETASSQDYQTKNRSNSTDLPRTKSTSSSERVKSSSTTSDDTSALLRSDNDDESQRDDDSESDGSDDTTDDDLASSQQKIDREKSRTTIPVPSSSSGVTAITEKDPLTNTMVTLNDQNTSRTLKGEYNPSQVLQLKESFRPIINEAASYGHLEVVRTLIQSGQSVHTQNMLQRTPLHEACVSGNGQLVIEILANGALVDQRDSQGMTALHVAARHGTFRCVRALCEKGCFVDAQDDSGQTAAHYCAMYNHSEVLKYLVEKRNINLSITNHETKLPIHYAAKFGARDILNYFFQSGLSTSGTDVHGNNIAHEASEYDQLLCIKSIRKYAQHLLIVTNKNGRTPAHMAALYGSSNVLHWFLELKFVNIEDTDKDGHTMAHLAASRGQGECLFCLIQHGAQIDQYTFHRHDSVIDLAKRSGKYSRIEKALQGTIQCSNCKEKLEKEKYDRAHARNNVEQLIHSQIMRGYHLHVPMNRSATRLSQHQRPTT